MFLLISYYKKEHICIGPFVKPHCIDFMLEDIGKQPLIKKTIQRAISLVGFTLSLLRYFTNKKILVSNAVTRLATSFSH